MLTVVIPMAGRGSRFADVGYELPKPLLPVHGVPMIEVVVRNLRPARAAPVRLHLPRASTSTPTASSRRCATWRPAARS